ncbi:MAG: hypothetical protein AB7I32_01490 [Gammaproteobacteria bacterium]
MTGHDTRIHGQNHGEIGACHSSQAQGSSTPLHTKRALVASQ